MTRTIENDDFAGAARRLMMSMRVRLLLALVALIDACRSDTLNRRYAQPLRSLLHRQLLPTAADGVTRGYDKNDPPKKTPAHSIPVAQGAAGNGSA